MLFFKNITDIMFSIQIDYVLKSLGKWAIVLRGIAKLTQQLYNKPLYTDTLTLHWLYTMKLDLKMIWVYIFVKSPLLHVEFSFWKDFINMIYQLGQNYHDKAMQEWAYFGETHKEPKEISKVSPINSSFQSDPISIYYFIYEN